MKDAAARLPGAGARRPQHQAALAACDAHDGVHRRRSSATRRPAAFDPRPSACPAAPTDACLTASQVDAARKIYSPAVNPRTGAEIYPGMPPGSERTWTALAGGPEPFSIPVDFYKYLVHANPAWDWKTMDFDTDVAAADKKYGNAEHQDAPLPAGDVRRQAPGRPDRTPMLTRQPCLDVGPAQAHWRGRPGPGPAPAARYRRCGSAPPAS